MLFVSCIDEFNRYLSSYASYDTRCYYDINLDFFTQFLAKRFLHLDFDINKIKKSDFIDYIAYCRDKNISDSSAATYSRAVRSFLRYCYREGFLLEDITKNVRLPKNDPRMILPLSQEQVDMLHDYFSRLSLGSRNLAIMYLMLDSGLRRSEVMKLNIDDIDMQTNFISIKSSKNRKSRVVPLSKNAKYYIIKYRSEVHTMLLSVGDVPRDPLFLNSKYDNRITNNAIELMFSKAKTYTDVKVYPHLLRHTFATSFILGGGNLEILRILLGHSSYNITQQYLHIATQSLFTHQNIYKLDDVFFQIYNYNK